MSDEHEFTTITPRSAPRAPVPRPKFIVDPTDPPWRQARSKLRNLIVDEAAGDPTAEGYLAADRRIREKYPELVKLADSWTPWPPGTPWPPAILGVAQPPEASVVSHAPAPAPPMTEEINAATDEQPHWQTAAAELQRIANAELRLNSTPAGRSEAFARAQRQRPDLAIAYHTKAGAEIDGLARHAAGARTAARQVALWRSRRGAVTLKEALDIARRAFPEPSYDA